MSKRVSGAPRRPRNPVARAVHTALYKQRVVPDKRWQERLPSAQEVVKEAEQAPDEDEGKRGAQ